MTRTKLAQAASGAIILLAAVSAQAGTYKTEPMIDSGKTLGCMSVNAEDGIVLMGVTNGISLIVSAPEFKVAKNDAVAGTWSIDDSKPLPLSDKANGTGTVSLDMPPTKENFQLVSSGDELKVTVGSAAHTFDLAGSAQAMTELTACMNKAGF